MLKTQITVTDPNELDCQLDAFAQSFGTGPGAVGEVIGYELFAPEGGLLAGGVGSPEEDRQSITRAFRDWEPSMLVDGKQLLLACKVIRFARKSGDVVVAPQETSDWLSLSEAFAFVFPAV